MRSARIVVCGLVAVSLSLAACREKSSSAAGDIATGKSAPLGGIYGTAGAVMMDSVHLYARAMANMSPDQVAAMMPRRSLMVTNVLAEMRREMQRANVTPSAEWTATSDSVQRDITRMPGMTKLQLKQTLPAQNARVERLIGIYQESMANAK